MALQTRTRVDSPARWMKAVARAVAEGVQVRQLQGSGQWIATSGTQAGTAYELAVTGNVAHGCDCLAGLNDDPVCKHRAAFYILIGALAVDPEPDPPAPAVFAPIVCFRCSGREVGCPVCAGAGVAALVAQAAALVAAASEAPACGLCVGAGYDDESGRICGLCGGTGIEPACICDHCGGPLDDDARTDDALQTLCGACVDADRAEAFTARRVAISAALAA